MLGATDFGGGVFIVKDGWVCCPKCKKKLFPLNAEAVIIDLEFRCRYCRQTLKINTRSHAPAEEKLYASN
jgi:predicted  nucleic acid-binding Zn ribbon protein